MHDAERCLYATSTAIIYLTKLENRLLGYLIQNKRKVVSIRDIAHFVYGESWQNRETSIRQFISILNRKIKDITIANVHGYGYAIFNNLGGKI